MIANITELKATLGYITKLADSLEGLRRYAQETGETALLPLSSAALLVHLREKLSKVRVYIESTIQATVESPCD